MNFTKLASLITTHHMLYVYYQLQTAGLVLGLLVTAAHRPLLLRKSVISYVLNPDSDRLADSFSRTRPERYLVSLFIFGAQTANVRCNKLITILYAFRVAYYCDKYINS